MEIVVGCIVCVSVLIVKWVVKNVNWLLYEKKLRMDIRHQLPPGDLGWPFFGNMLSFLRAFKSPNPESFLANFASRYTFHYHINSITCTDEIKYDPVQVRAHGAIQGAHVREPEHNRDKPRSMPESSHRRRRVPARVAGFHSQPHGEEIFCQHIRQRPQVAAQVDRRPGQRL